MASALYRDHPWPITQDLKHATVKIILKTVVSSDISGARLVRRSILPAALLLALVFLREPMWADSLFSDQLALPKGGKSQRVTLRPELPSGSTLVLFDQEGPGCILHWWLTCKQDSNDQPGRRRTSDLRLRFYYDGDTQPAVDLTLAQFFSVLLGRDAYPIDNAAIKVLPRNAFNCYFPIPFRKLRIELENTGTQLQIIWFMADWRLYSAKTKLTPLRFHAVYQEQSPAQQYGSLLMADFTGEGFIAGMTQAITVRDDSDSWYHTGGDTIYLDGETAPHAIRGIGGEDVFNMSFGIWPVQSSWVGAPVTERTNKDSTLGSGYNGVMYRIFGPDPILFQTSAIARFGTKANDTESVIYAYLEPRPAPTVKTSVAWSLAGPFACNTTEDFARHEWPEDAPDTWPKEHKADFGPYISNYKATASQAAVFPVPITLRSEHTWCDFVRAYRGRRSTNVGAQPVAASAYALGSVTLPTAGDYNLSVGFDDWITVWVNGEKVFNGRHEKGFASASTKLRLSTGRNRVLVKLANFDNQQWRLWAFTLRFDPYNQ